MHVIKWEISSRNNKKDKGKIIHEGFLYNKIVKTKGVIKYG